MPDTWAATDALGRVLPMSAEVGAAEGKPHGGHLLLQLACRVWEQGGA
jgi:hypothetical protein